MFQCYFDPKKWKSMVKNWHQHFFKILCFFQKKEMHVGSKPHEGVSDDRILIYG